MRLTAKLLTKSGSRHIQDPDLSAQNLIEYLGDDYHLHPVDVPEPYVRNAEGTNVASFDVIVINGIIAREVSIYKIQDPAVGIIEDWCLAREFRCISNRPNMLIYQFREKEDWEPHVLKYTDI